MFRPVPTGSLPCSVHGEAYHDTGKPSPAATVSSIHKPSFSDDPDIRGGIDNKHDSESDPSSFRHNYPDSWSQLFPMLLPVVCKSQTALSSQFTHGTLSPAWSGARVCRKEVIYQPIQKALGLIHSSEVHSPTAFVFGMSILTSGRQCLAHNRQLVHQDNRYSAEERRCIPSDRSAR